MKVLIVDDEAQIRRVLRKWVEAEGHEVLEAGSAEDALSLVGDDLSPAIVLCDIRMPGQGGLWLAGELRRTRPATAIVMLTALQDFDVAVTSLQTGAVDYVSKPCARERLLEALQRAVDAHEERKGAVEMQEALEIRRALLAEALAVAPLRSK